MKIRRKDNQIIDCGLNTCRNGQKQNKTKQIKQWSSLMKEGCEKRKLKLSG